MLAKNVMCIEEGIIYHVSDELEVGKELGSKEKIVQESLDRHYLILRFNATGLYLSL